MGTAAHATALQYEQRRPETTLLYRLNAFSCKYEGLGAPITVPIIAFEGAW